MSKGCMNKKLCFSEKWKFVIFIKRVNSRLQKTKKTRFVRVFWQSLFMQPLLTGWFWILNKKRKHNFRSVRCALKYFFSKNKILVFVKIVHFWSISRSG